MITVALIGPDGAGKSTLSQRLTGRLSCPVRHVYMGINPEASNHMLPTTRLLRAVRRRMGNAPDAGGPREHNASEAAPRSPAKRLVKGLRAWLRMGNRIAEEWYRVGVAAAFRRQGFVVLFDRHFFADYHAYDIAGADISAPNRLHGWMLQRLYPKPDLVIYLDAPAKVLFDRKGEGTLELLEQRRQDYLSLREHARNFAVVDTTQPLEAATEELVSTIERFLESRSRARTGGSRAPSR
jgi:thymidylate kinase